ncbi:uncharacterized protein HD556DRAFT_1439878 [Suillus plorans]|uniref:Uncharacterized protein n=1 Tax=Suillus plorans TaxID=116603 RepID=A0A9P7J1C6_9AGAM|nr:uncharacterized protein HD556DRAFT_1439878 [Suillus plorans]KAG1798818.1 hypothetical protein HD556DRAFT_1439878 [Suillus plorans]
MATSSKLVELQLIPYDPDNPKRRATPSECQSHHLQLYAHAGSTSEAPQYSEASSMASGSFVSSDTSKKKVKKLALSDLPANDRPAVKWARKRVVMDLLTTVLWSQNETEQDIIYLNEIVGQANAMFGTNIVLTKDLAGLIHSAPRQFRSDLMQLVDKVTKEFMLEPPVPMSKDCRAAYMANRRTVLFDSSEEN